LAYHFTTKQAKKMRIPNKDTAASQVIESELRIILDGKLGRLTDEANDPSVRKAASDAYFKLEEIINSLEVSRLSHAVTI